MTRYTKFLLLIGALTLSVGTGVPIALGAETCPNAQLRVEDNSTTLSDCRAYELVSPDSNHADIEPSGRTAASGDMMVYVSNDAPDNALSGVALANFVRSTRDAATGWSEAALQPPLPDPITAFASVNPKDGMSADLSSTFMISDQPLSAGIVPPGLNYFIGRADGTYTMVSRVATPMEQFARVYPVGSLLGSSPDFSHVYFGPQVAQFPADPSGNFYGWSADNGLQLVGILPGGAPAPDGAEFQGNSDDGRYVAFTNDGTLYLRIDEERTVSIGELTIDHGNQNLTDQAIVPGRGGKVLFTSRTRQAPDANQAGKDLYSYDIASGVLTDLTVDTNPADAATGAEVRKVLGATADGSYIYFTAEGDLAEGATPGQSSLYVWHNGTIQFVARAGGLFIPGGVMREFYLTPDGQHLVFLSTDSLTGYDNVDRATGQPHAEVFEATIGAGIQCASCRADGTRPTGDSVLAGVAGVAVRFGGSQARIASDDGRRVFFQSTDAVVPQASNGLEKVFEYSNGRPSPISQVDSAAPAILLDASVSGDDVFFTTHDELIPNRNGGDSAVYDARVDGGFPLSSLHECSGVTCRAPVGPAPVLAVPTSTAISGGASAAASAPVAQSVSKPLTRAQKLSRALKACRSRHNKKKRAACEKKARRTYGRGR